jgi:DnaA family protein
LEEELYRQLLLGITSSGMEDFNSFYIFDGNKCAFDCISNLILSDDIEHQNQFIYLYGNEYCGKSHLLKIAFSEAQKKGYPAIYFDLSQYVDMDPGTILDGVEDLTVICIDNVDKIKNSWEWQSELFSLYNRWMSRRSGAFIVAANDVADNVGFSKPDLITRLLSGVTLELEVVPLDLLPELLVMREKWRGGELNIKQAKTLVNNFPNIVDCLKALDELDNIWMEKKIKYSDRKNEGKFQPKAFHEFIARFKNRLQK